MEKNNWNMVKAVTSAGGKSARDLGECFDGRWQKRLSIDRGRVL